MQQLTSCEFRTVQEFYFSESRHERGWNGKIIPNFKYLAGLLKFQNWFSLGSLDGDYFEARIPPFQMYSPPSGSSDCKMHWRYDIGGLPP